jgi:hypothetical protein
MTEDFILIDKTGLLPGKTRTLLQDALGKEVSTGVPWAKKLAQYNDDDNLFENWKFATSAHVKLSNIQFKSFLNANGQLVAKNKLSLHPITNEFICTGTVVVDWVTEPTKISGDLAWYIEVFSSINRDFPELATTFKIKGSIRSKKIDLSDFVQDEDQRFFLRISALDDLGGVILKDDGEVASAVSEVFLLVSSVASSIDGPEPKSANINSIGEAWLDATLKDKSFDADDSEVNGIDLIPGVFVVGRMVFVFSVLLLLISCPCPLPLRPTPTPITNCANF